MTTATPTAPRPLWFKILFAFSLIGPLLKDVKMGDDTTLAFFAANYVMLWVIAGFIWGIAGVLAGAYILVPSVFSFILGVMLFSGK